MGRREPTKLEQRGLRLGISAWRSLLARTRPSEWTNANNKGRRGRPSTIFDGGLRIAVVDALPRTASSLPYRRSGKSKQSPIVLVFETRVEERI
jgi:hypothetical protein